MSNSEDEGFFPLSYLSVWAPLPGGFAGTESRRRLLCCGERKNQGKRIEQCIDRLGLSEYSVKDAGAKMMAMMQGLGGMFAGDEVVKGAMASYAFEHFEISAYTALMGAAEEAGDQETAAVCRDILREEEAMADWLKEHLPSVTREFLARESAEGPAKR